MIKYLAQKDINITKYDSCVLHDASGLPYGYSWYLNSVAASWDALVLGDYEAVWPLPYKVKWGFKYFYRPHGVQQLGVFSKAPLSQEMLFKMARTMLKHCYYADIYLNEFQLLANKKVKNLEVEEVPNFCVDVSDTYQSIFDNFSSNTKRVVKKTLKEKWELFENDSPEKLVNLFKETRGATLGLDEDFYVNFKKIMYQCVHKGIGKVYTIYGSGNQIIAGAFLVETAHRVVFLFSGLSEEGKKRNAMRYLINEQLIWASQKNRLFDFEGSKDENLAKFYSSFGAENRPYCHLKYNNLPWPLNRFKK